MTTLENMSYLFALTPPSGAFHVGAVCVTEWEERPFTHMDTA